MFERKLRGYLVCGDPDSLSDGERNNKLIIIVILRYHYLSLGDLELVTRTYIDRPPRSYKFIQQLSLAMIRECFVRLRRSGSHTPGRSTLSAGRIESGEGSLRSLPSDKLANWILRHTHTHETPGRGGVRGGERAPGIRAASPCSLNPLLVAQ